MGKKECQSYKAQSGKHETYGLAFKKEMAIKYTIKTQVC